MIDGNSTAALRDLALEVRPSRNEWFAAHKDLIANGAVIEGVGRTGARVTKFVFGLEEAAELVVLAQQPGHDTVAGHVHGVETYNPSFYSFRNRYKFDRGRLMTVDDVTLFMGTLAAEGAVDTVS